MTWRRILTTAFCLALVIAAEDVRAQQPAGSARSQDRGRVGLTIAYPASSGASGLIGLIWHTSDRLAFRPEISIAARIAGESANGGANDSWSLGATLTVLRYVGLTEDVAAYVGPRFSYSRAWSNGSGSNTRNAGYGIGINGGLQYSLAKKIKLVGEVGLGYAYTTYAFNGQTYGQHDTVHSIGSRGALGLNLYF